MMAAAFTQRVVGSLARASATAECPASVGVSVRSQAAPRYAIAGRARTVALRSLCIGLLLTERRRVGRGDEQGPSSAHLISRADAHRACRPHLRHGVS